MKKYVYYFLFLGFIANVPALAQTAPTAGTATPTYTLLIFHKLAPGKTFDDAMPVEREWKAINQAAVDEGNLIGWHMLVRQAEASKPQHTDYDYVTCIVTTTRQMKGTSPAAMAKLYGDSVQVRMADLQRRDKLTAPVVKMEWFKNTDFFITDKFSPAKTKLITIDFLKVNSSETAMSGTLAAMKKAAIPQLDQGYLSGWSFSALQPGTTEASYSHLVARAVIESKQAVDQPVISPSTVVRHDTFRFGQFTVWPGK